ncbi:early light-induced protein 1, chloroplastic-like [Euphorbia lathyris]|uniref:early light-induced protein 1, chloroplastic-like n=1 Tax=Euphorbia lathyris TaxID=212925 RepID=UPI003313F438
MAVATSSILSSPVMRTLSSRACVSPQFLAAPSRHTIARFSTSVKCMAQENKNDIQKKQKFSDILAFSGPAPERINGRLAMIGFVAAVAVELANGHDLLSQVSDGGVTWFVGSSVLLSLASLIPLLKGVSVESKSDGFMTSDAELWNGRLAMLGLVALAFTEYVKGGAFI